MTYGHALFPEVGQSTLCDKDVRTRTVLWRERKKENKMGKHKTPAEREIALRVGARIRQLREIQHVSQIRLATEIGIRAGPLGWIEKGKHLPSGRVLYRIAKQLNVRLDDLFQETDVWQNAAPSATLVSVVMLPPFDVAASAEEVKAAHIMCQTVADRVIELEKLCGVLRPSDIPLHARFSSTEQGADCLAARVRRGLGLACAVVTDCIEQFEAAGLRVVFLDLPEGCPSFAAYDCANRNALLFLNARLKKQPELQVWRAVVELARIYWFTRKQDGADREPLSMDEVLLDEAAFVQRFAGAFLMPTCSLQAAIGQLGLTSKLWTWEMVLRMKRRYGVSALQFAARLGALKLSWCDKQKKTPKHFAFKDELDAFSAENGSSVEPGGNRPQLIVNGRLCDLLLRAEQVSGRDQKALNAIKRVLRQAGVRLDA